VPLVDVVDAVVTVDETVVLVAAAWATNEDAAMGANAASACE